MLREANTERAVLQQRLRDVDKLIGVLEGMAESKPDPVEASAIINDTYPRPREAMFRAIKSRPGVLLMPKEVTALVKEMGLFNPTLKSGATAYTTALSRLSDEDDTNVERRGDAYIFLPTVAQALSGEV